MLRGMVEKGRTPIPNSWAIVAAGYVAKENMEKAFKCMKEAAVAVQQRIMTCLLCPTSNGNTKAEAIGYYK